jgi:hypothetical protein
MIDKFLRVIEITSFCMSQSTSQILKIFTGDDADTPKRDLDTPLKIGLLFINSWVLINVSFYKTVFYVI